MKKYGGNITEYERKMKNRKIPGLPTGGGKSYGDTIPEMAPSTEREDGSPTTMNLQKQKVRILLIWTNETSRSLHPPDNLLFPWQGYKWKTFGSLYLKFQMSNIVLNLLVVRYGILEREKDTSIRKIFTSRSS